MVTGTRKTKDFPILPLFAMLGILCSILAYQYQRHGASIFFSQSHFDLHNTAEEWQSLLDGKILLLLGGQHRGGTTLLWKILDAHPEISGLATTSPSVESVDGIHEKRKCGEGILIQNVYSRHGIGVEYLMKNNLAFQKKMVGMGRYALGEESSVHLTEKDRRVTPKNMAKLLNRYSYYWNTTKRVLVEKSPPNAVMSRFLQAIYRQGSSSVGDGDAGGGGGGGVGLLPKFIFVTRHPIANVLAHKVYLDGAYHVPLSTLFDNYVKVHQYIKADLPHLQKNGEPMIIHLENLTADPEAAVAKVFNWAGVDAKEATVKDVLHSRLAEKIIADPNAKYRESWCSGKNDSEVWNRQKDLALQYQPVIDELGLGYDLVGWCDE